MSKTKRLLVASLTALLLLSNGIPALGAASEITGRTGFVRSSVPPPIVNPLAPEEEVDIGTGGTTGLLSIDFVPDLDFGNNQAITTSDQIHYAEPLTVTDRYMTQIKVPNFIQITDNRGTGAGWKLGVSATEFKTSGGKVLKGAVITFDNANVYTPNSSSETPDAITPVTLETAGTSYTILRAEQGNGLATWGVSFAGTEDAATGEKSVKLYVPGSVTKLAETYTATLTWNLEDTPY